MPPNQSLQATHGQGYLWVQQYARASRVHDTPAFALCAWPLAYPARLNAGALALENLMNPRRALLLSILATVAFLIASFASVTMLVGHPARLVDVVGLFFGGFGSGAGFASTVLAWRRSMVRPASCS